MWRRTPWILRKLFGLPAYRRRILSEHNCMGWNADYEWEYAENPS